MCGVKTNIITAAEATPGESSDHKRFAPFVEATAQHFTIQEVSADKAYLSKKNLRAVEAVGGVTYIPFKSNSNPTSGHHKRDALWEHSLPLLPPAPDGVPSSLSENKCAKR